MPDYRSKDANARQTNHLPTIDEVVGMTVVVGVSVGMTVTAGSTVVGTVLVGATDGSIVELPDDKTHMTGAETTARCREGRRCGDLPRLQAPSRYNMLSKTLSSSAPTV